MLKKLIVFILICAGALSAQQMPVFESSPIGFASVNAWGQNGTTGGAGGDTVTVTTAADFLKYIAAPDTLVILVKGTIALTPGTSQAANMHNITSHKTILGLGSDALVTGGGLNIGHPYNDNVTQPYDSAIHNVIIRNISLRGSGDDAINVMMFAHHVWIDHCDLSGARDGLVDIKRGANFITVSWNYCHHHNKTWLLGHDNDNGPQDIGRLKITYHHNFCDSTKTRTPRVRFGEPVHIYNNYFTKQNYAVASTCEAGVLVEANYFQDMDNPLRVDFDGEPLGKAVQRLNITDNCDNDMQVRGTVEEPSLYYSYHLDSASVIPAMVRLGAGVGRIVLTGISEHSPAGNPDGYTLNQNFPNPFNPATEITYETGRAGMVTLTVYDVLGRSVRTLIREEQQAGGHRASFNAAGLPSGIYYAVLHAGSRTLSRKMVFIK